jgi:hypothetical protein
LTCAGASTQRELKKLTAPSTEPSVVFRARKASLARRGRS